MNYPKLSATTLAALLLTLTLQSCAIHMTRLTLGDPPKGKSSPVTISSDKSSLATIVRQLRDKSETPIVVIMDPNVAANTYFTGTVSANTWPEAFEQILQRTGVAYTRKFTSIPIFNVPGKN
ncbi:MAG: hypothetical protein AAF591_10710 [Verrucomicrobiota bacterium]